MGKVLSFPARTIPQDRARLAGALDILSRHLEQILSSLREGLSMLDHAGILPEVRDELAAAAGRAVDLADWLAVVRRQLPDLPPERLCPAITPLMNELNSLDLQAQAILDALPGRVEKLLRRG